MSRTATIRELRQLLRQGGGAPASGSTVETDWPPGDCLAAGGVSEWISRQPGSGAMTLALATARCRLPAESRWLMVDPEGDLHPAALAPVGVNLSRTVFVQSRSSADALWAVEQGLRSRGVDGVCTRLERLSNVTGRRLKLAAEAGRSRCLLIRDARALRETSWADARMLVTPVPSGRWSRRRWRVQVLKVRNGFPGGVITLELNDETGAVRVVPELADPADLRRATGA